MQPATANHLTVAAPAMLPLFHYFFYRLVKGFPPIDVFCPRAGSRDRSGEPSVRWCANVAATMGFDGSPEPSRDSSPRSFAGIQAFHPNYEGILSDEASGISGRPGHSG